MYLSVGRHPATQQASLMPSLPIFHPERDTFKLSNQVCTLLLLLLSPFFLAFPCKLILWYILVYTYQVVRIMVLSLYLSPPA